MKTKKNNKKTLKRLWGHDEASCCSWKKCSRFKFSLKRPYPSNIAFSLENWSFFFLEFIRNTKIVSIFIPHENRYFLLNSSTFWQLVLSRTKKLKCYEKWMYTHTHKWRETSKLLNKILKNSLHLLYFPVSFSLSHSLYTHHLLYIYTFQIPKKKSFNFLSFLLISFCFIFGECKNCQYQLKFCGSERFRSSSH